MWHLAERSVVLGFLALLCCLPGCVSLGQRSQQFASPHLVSYSPGAAAEAEIERAAALEAAGDEGCVDSYFRACSFAWQSLSAELPEAPRASTCRCYSDSVTGLLRTAQRFGRLDLAQGLRIRDGQRVFDVPIVLHAFPWDGRDFHCLHPPPTGKEPLLSRRYECLGVGAPLVVERRRNDESPIESRFLAERFYFAATAVLRFDAAEAGSWTEGAVLEFHNPLQVRRVQVREYELPLAIDLSAPLAKTVEEAPRSYFAGFIDPGGAATSARLTFLEPYQPEKSPVVLIHGLFSDPQSWADLVNDLRAAPAFAERHQLWVFRYPTGQGFLQSAAALRRELHAATTSLDPQQQDAALGRMVLVGHSMGGLIAKLQVAYSEELVWTRLANRPLEEIVTSDSTRAFLAEACYFEPSPNVSRVIFIASPHAGSLCSSALVGQGTSLLIEPSPAQRAMQEQLIRDNPGTFNPVVERRFPTSIDMLMPSSPLLEAMQHMRLRPGLALHNLIGVSHPVSLDGPSDGVVSVHSASHPGCRTVLAIGASHVKVHRTLEASQEVLRILNCDR
jgi:pimeloyl-ACP methyl ester carboxylesterase